MKQPLTPRLLIFLTVFVDLLGFGIIIPILGPIGAEYLPPELAGRAVALLMASFSVLQMVCSPFWGRLSDKYGRRPILLLSLCGSTASYVIFALAPSFGWILLSRMLAGFFGANITTAMAYIADITPDRDRTAGMGLIGMAFGLGFALGPVLGAGASILGQTQGIHPQVVLGVMAGAICGLNLVWAAARLPESLPPEKRGQVSFRRFATLRRMTQTLRHELVGPLILLFFVLTFAFANVETAFGIFARFELGMDLEGGAGDATLAPHENPIYTQIYALFVLIGLVMAVVQGWFIRKAVKFVPEQLWIVIGNGILAVGLFFFPFARSPGDLILPVVILAVGQGIANPCVLSLISRNTPADRQGDVFGTSQSMSSLARIIGPLFAGLIYDFGGPRWPFWAAGGLVLLAAAWANRVRWRLIRHRPVKLTGGGEAATEIAG